MAQAAWRKYPNPMNPAVIGTDVIDRKVINGVLHTHRLVGSTWYFPRWAQSVSINYCFGVVTRKRLPKIQLVLLAELRTNDSYKSD